MSEDSDQWMLLEDFLKAQGYIDERIERIGSAYGRRYDASFFDEQAELMAGPGSHTLAHALEQFQQQVSVAGFAHDVLSSHLRDVDVDLSRYSAVLDVRKDRSLMGNGFGTKWYDGTFAIGLCHDGVLAALTCFEPLFGGAKVTCVQGMKGASEALRPLKWQRALVEYVVDFAREFGIPDVYVQSVDNNVWATDTFRELKEAGLYPGLSFDDAKRLSYRQESRVRREAAERNLEVHLMPRQGARLYDATAECLGFEKIKSGDYRYSLS